MSTPPHSPSRDLCHGGNPDRSVRDVPERLRWIID